MTRRILQSIQLDKIAAVDKPCQEHAVVTIMKRAEEPDITKEQRLTDLRHTLIGASFVLKNLMEKQSYYVGLKHPEEGVKHFTCDAGNRRGARGKALKEHPGHTIFRLHERANGVKKAKGFGAKRGFGGRRGGGFGFGRRARPRVPTIFERETTVTPPAETGTGFSLTARRIVRKVAYEAEAKKARNRRVLQQVGTGGPNADERGIAKAWPKGGGGGGRFPGGRGASPKPKSLGLANRGPRQPRPGAGLGARALSQVKQPNINVERIKPSAGVGQRGQRRIPGLGRLKGESGTSRKPRLTAKQLVILKVARLADLVAKSEDAIELVRKVIGNTAADYIHDFVHSTNSKFKDKSKEERIRMALGAFYNR